MPGRCCVKFDARQSAALSVPAHVVAWLTIFSQNSTAAIRHVLRTCAFVCTTVAPIDVHSNTETSFGQCTSTMQDDPPVLVGSIDTSTGHKWPTTMHFGGIARRVLTPVTSVLPDAANLRCRRRLRTCALRMRLQKVFATSTRFTLGEVV
jgi:hypothetical protein